MSDLFELDQTQRLRREEAAARLHALADALARHNSVEFEKNGHRITVDVPDEVDKAVTYPAGTIAMAKRQAPNTGGSQFFLVWADTELPPEYTVFGTMDQAGLDVVGGIAAQGVDGVDGMSPIAEARIQSVTMG